MYTNNILSIAKKEIMDNIRNKWIIIVSVIFASLTIISSYLGTLYSGQWSDIGGTIVAMMSFVQYLLSVIALILGYGTIIGEVERGSMSALLSLSVTRFEIIAGKYLGLACVLGLTILVGFGTAGALIAANVPNVNFVEFLLFLIGTVLFGLIFLAISIFFSTIFKKRSTAIGGAVFLWFFFLFLLPIIFSVILIGSIGLENLLNGAIPDWYYGLEMLNPVTVYSYFVSLNVVSISQFTGGAPVSIHYPSFISNVLIVPVLFLWIAVFFILGWWRFNTQDI
jgi:Cu-processing system permease protein